MLHADVSKTIVSERERAIQRGEMIRVAKTGQEPVKDETLRQRVATTISRAFATQKQLPESHTSVGGAAA